MKKVLDLYGVLVVNCWLEHYRKTQW